MVILLLLVSWKWHHFDLGYCIVTSRLLCPSFLRLAPLPISEEALCSFEPCLCCKGHGSFYLQETFNADEELWEVLPSLRDVVSVLSHHSDIVKFGQGMWENSMISHSMFDTWRVGDRVPSLSTPWSLVKCLTLGELVIIYLLCFADFIAMMQNPSILSASFGKFTVTFLHYSIDAEEDVLLYLVWMVKHYIRTQQLRWALRHLF